MESNPTLKADANFRALQDELVGTENRVATARGDYNNAVNEYNAYIRRFPAVIGIALLSGVFIGLMQHEHLSNRPAARRRAAGLT